MTRSLGRMPFKRKPSDCVPLEDKEQRAYRRSFAKDPWPTMSDECVDFVEKVLDPDPATRPSAKEALKHPWLVRAAANLKEKRLSLQSADEKSPMSYWTNEPGSPNPRQNYIKCSYSDFRIRVMKLWQCRTQRF